MIISANQPYFAPFSGFFYKAELSDVMVILDSVQFPRGTTWLSRNRFKNDQGTLWLTIPVRKKGLGLQRINNVRICHDGNWKAKHLQSLKLNYANSPWLADYMDQLESLFSFQFERLIDLNMAVLSFLMEALAIKTEIVLLSELGIEATGIPLIIEICKALGAKKFLAPLPVRKYMNPVDFHNQGIDLVFVSRPSPVYPQLWGEFVPNLSAIDLLLNCGPKSHDMIVK